MSIKKHTQLTKNFNSREFDSKDLPYSGNLMDQHLVYLLQTIREKINKPLVITSGFRTQAYNKKVGGVFNSSHMSGLAVDISAITGVEKFLIIKYALEVGITRIGIGKNFIHIDVDSSKPSPNVWIY